MRMIDRKLIEEVRADVACLAFRTPCLPSEWLGEILGGEVWLKCENLQRTGSFKVRGPLARLPRLSDDERRRGVLAASAGNHGKGLAWAARHHGVACTVCVPRTIPENKEAAIRALGARVVKTAHDGYDDTQDEAIALARETGAVWVSPFDDDLIMAGNGGTTALEILEDLPGIDAIVAPCGGGGFVVGAGAAARPGGTRVIGVNSDASPGMWLSRRDGRAHLRVESRPTIAEGLEGGVTERSFALAREHVDGIVVAREATICRAVGEVFRRQRMAVEGSGAAGVAAVLDGVLPAGLRRVCVVLTGSNIDDARLLELAGRR